MPETITAESVRTWLIERVAFYAECPPDLVAPSARLVDLGLDSVYGLTLAGDIEDEFDIEVEATLGWDHPTVQAIADFVVSALEER